MRQSAVALCPDKASLHTLETTLDQLGVDLHNCSSEQQALQQVVGGQCAALIVDFDVPGAEEVIRMASLLPAAQKPILLAVASRAWPGTGRAFQSGANRILYRPLSAEQIKDAFSTKKPVRIPRRSARYEMKTLVYLELENSTLPGITIDIGEHGLALQASERVPMHSNVPFRCALPGTDFTLHGHADVIWASEHGRAGLFFSRLAPASRKHLKHWLSRRAHSRDHAHGKGRDTVRELLPPTGERVLFAASE